jgi:hypothetical protein
MFLRKLNSLYQGCQMAYLHSKNPNVGVFWMVYLCWYMLWPVGTFYCHSVYIAVIHYIFVHFVFFVYICHFGIQYRVNSGSPGLPFQKLNPPKPKCRNVDHRLALSRIFSRSLIVHTRCSPFGTLFFHCHS